MKKDFFNSIRKCVFAMLLLLPSSINASTTDVQNPMSLHEISYAEDNKDVVKYFVIWDNEGGTVAFPLKERPRIVTDVELQIISCITSKQEVSFSINEVHKYTLEASSENLNIEDTESSEGEFYRNDNTLIFDNYPENTPVSVYNLDGIKIKSYTTDVNGSLSISSEGWQAGVYLIKVGSVTYKIVKK